MSEEKKPWWWPVEVNDEYFERLRSDYPDKSEWSNDRLMEYFSDGWEEFSDTWDHLGDARDEYEKLARAFLNLVKECGKKPADFIESKEGS